MISLVIVGEKPYDILMKKLKLYLTNGYAYIKCIIASDTLVDIDDIPVYNITKITNIVSQDDFLVVSDDVTDYIDQETFNESHIIPARVIINFVGFDLKDYIKLKKRGISIISDTCWGGMVYHALGMRFTSPLINTSVAKSDFLMLIGNLKYYFSCEMEKYSERDAYTPPIGILDGKVKIMFNHYLDFEEGKRMWEKRITRVNYSNIFIQTNADMNDQDIKQFDNCPYNKKAFSRIPKENKDIVYLSQYESSEVRIATGEFTGYIQNIIQSRPLYPRPIDLLKMLNLEDDFIRIN